MKPPDWIPKTYDRKVFQLDGRLDLDICFDGLTMRTPVYVKLDAADQLLLGEGVFRQLRIITYHPSVTAKRSRCGSKETTSPASAIHPAPGNSPTTGQDAERRSDRAFPVTLGQPRRAGEEARWITPLLCRLQGPQRSHKSRQLPTTPDRGPARPTREIYLFLFH